MAETSPRMRPWVAFTLGGVAALLLAFGWTAWDRSRGAARNIDMADAVPHAPTLPLTPRLPDAPRIPDAPLPSPR